MEVKDIVLEFGKLLNVEVSQENIISGIIPFSYFDIEDQNLPKIEVNISMVIQDIDEIDTWITYKSGKIEGKLDYFYTHSEGNLLETYKGKITKNEYNKIIERFNRLTNNRSVFLQLKDIISSKVMKETIKVMLK